METLQNLDIWLFHFLNSGITNPLFDKIMPLITKADSWLLLYIWGFLYLFAKEGKRGILVATSLVIVVILADQVSSSLIKEWVGRMRPCHTLDGARLLVDCGAGKSFPSSHAANNFAAALIIAFYYPRYKWLYFSTAFLVALSRVYIGVHYPLDIIGGALLGLFFGWIVVYTGKKLFSKKNFYSRGNLNTSN